jgi:hypothetical protein
VSETLTSLASENVNPSLRSLLEDVQRGHIRVPRFQRPFVWTNDQRIELLRSIRDSVPIGSLLVWRTATMKLATFPTVGPHQLPPIAENAPSTGWQYLLDGHQRVSTLLGMLLAPSPQSIASRPPPNEDEIDWDIQYDLEAQDFVFAARAKNAARPLLPLRTLLDGRLVSRHMRELRKKAGTRSWSNQDLDTWEERADQLSYRFQMCRIPIVVMVTDDLSSAAQAFQRVNSMGTRMDESNFVAALTWTQDFDLRERLKALKADFPSGWNDLEDVVFLQVCKGLADLDMTKVGQMALANKMREDPSLLDRAISGLLQATKWLAENAHVCRRELLPYAFQVVLLAVEWAQFNERMSPHRAVLQWFWSTCWSESFASATYRQVKAEQNRLRAAVEGKSEQLFWEREQELPELFTFRSAHVRLFMLRLASRPGLIDGYGHPAHGPALLSGYGRNALVKLFSAPNQASASLKKLLQGAGNRFLLPPDEAKAFRAQLLTGPEFSIDGLRAHFIDQESLAALRNGDLETFLSRRASAMNDWDRAEFEAAKREAHE